MNCKDLGAEELAVMFADEKSGVRNWTLGFAAIWHQQRKWAAISESGSRWKRLQVGKVPEGTNEVGDYEL